MKVYQVTKEQCQKQIDELGNVCDRCGRDIVPIETVNNSGEPTYWAGCMHGQDCGHFTYGAKKEVYELAKKLVMDDDLDFGMKSSDRKIDLQYAWENAVSHACSIIKRIEYAKNHDPRYTKETLFKHYKELQGAKP